MPEPRVDVDIQVVGKSVLEIEFGIQKDIGRVKIDSYTVIYADRERCRTDNEAMRTKHAADENLCVHCPEGSPPIAPEVFHTDSRKTPQLV